MGKEKSFKIHALIPARSGSKRVPDKNIKELSGVPLMVYSIMAAHYSSYISQVWVSTDSLKYAKIASEHGAHYLPRPPELAGDDVRDYEVVAHFIDSLMGTLLDVPDYIAYLRPTTPLRKVPAIDMAIKDFHLLCTEAQTQPTSLRSVELMSESAFKCYTMLGQLLTPIGDPDQPNQEATKTYKPNGYIDIIRPRLMLASGNLWGNRVCGFETAPVIEIDTPHEFKLAQYQVAYQEGDKFVFAC